ncbi:hypothetical protein QYE76_029911 [Lolium multiflorum]|uniref:TF-B3 domain-containing protein n=1 Tax=Lolium multiflorum TaxID=4521 RepID=A0AAD8QSE0_LOLMU|nr:hypothetical protein QYE76_029911 [Lolium multiflorum]
MENYSLLMGAAAVMKMAVEMAAVSMEKPSGGTSPLRRVPEQRLLSPRSWLRDDGGSGTFLVSWLSPEINHIATGTAPSLDGELLPPHGSSSGDEDGGGDGSGVDGEAFRGTSPLGRVERETLSPDLGFAMAAARNFSRIVAFSASCGYYRWIVDAIYDARGKMYLNIGWEKFARHHSLEAGFILLFSYFGDRDMSVKVFDETRCRRDYHGDSTDEEDD